jgi:SAM-dependent methyltransferase
VTAEGDPFRNLRALLRTVGYSTDGLRKALGIGVPDDIGLLNHAATLERLRRDRSRLATLTRLWFLESGEPEGRVASHDTIVELQRIRLVRRRSGLLWARLRIDAVGDNWLLSDLRFRSPDMAAFGLPAGDPVYPPSSDSLLLRDAISSVECGTALDLCTGSGVQALGLAARTRRVLAGDVSARAVAVARANAVLNQLGNVEIRRGDLYRPFGRTRFDIIVANPPFVASPYTAGPAYHSGGPTGARVLRRIIAGLPDALAPRGRFFAISHLALRRGETVVSAVRPMFREFAGRALALVLESGSSFDLAAAQSLFALSDGLSAYAAEVRRWGAFLARHHVREIAVVILAAERGGRSGFEAAEAFQRTLPLPLSHPPRHHLEQWLAGA